VIVAGNCLDDVMPGHTGERDDRGHGQRRSRPSGHTPPGIGPDGARADYEHAVKLAGGLVHYVVDALVPDGEMVAVAWTGTLPGGAEMKGLSLYRVTGGLLRSTRHALIGDMPG
jgi:hypothetical protein